MALPISLHRPISGIAAYVTVEATRSSNRGGVHSSATAKLNPPRAYSSGRHRPRPEYARWNLPRATREAHDRSSPAKKPSTAQAERHHRTGLAGSVAQTLLHPNGSVLFAEKVQPSSPTLRSRLDKFTRSSQSLITHEAHPVRPRVEHSVPHAFVSRLIRRHRRRVQRQRNVPQIMRKSS